MKKQSLRGKRKNKFFSFVGLENSEKKKIMLFWLRSTHCRLQAEIGGFVCSRNEHAELWENWTTCFGDIEKLLRHNFSQRSRSSHSSFYRRTSGYLSPPVWGSGLRKSHQSFYLQTFLHRHRSRPVILFQQGKNM